MKLGELKTMFSLLAGLPIRLMDESACVTTRPLCDAASSRRAGHRLEEHGRSNLVRGGCDHAAEF